MICPNRRRKFSCKLTSSFRNYIYAKIFLPLLILENAGVWIFQVDLFFQIKDFTSKYTEKSGTMFWFCISRVKLWEKEVRISILSEGDASSLPVLVRKTTFSYTMKFWSPLNNLTPPTTKTWPPHLKAMRPHPLGESSSSLNSDRAVGNTAPFPAQCHSKVSMDVIPKDFWRFQGV